MDRPRRSTRQPAKEPKVVANEGTSQPTKRKVSEPVDPEKQLKTLLQSSKSELASIEITEILNLNAWGLLSEESQTRLKELLPPTAFIGYQPSISSDHPSLQDQMAVDSTRAAAEPFEAELNPGFFADSHFLSAARTFQAHLSLNWFSDSHIARVAEFNSRIKDGTLAAPWKDEVWERSNPTSESTTIPQEAESSTSFTLPDEANTRVGGAADIKLTMLAKNGIVRVGDVIAYRRSFPTGEVVEKDTLVSFLTSKRNKEIQYAQVLSIQPRTNALSMVTQPGSTKDLPSQLLAQEGEDPGEGSRIMIVTSPTMLETGLLDLDGRTDKARRTNNNSVWKSFTLWRWRTGGVYNPYDSRGGRENHGTLFYLRGSYYHDQG
ncbi:hypothetical protein CVT24_001854 [Panaeolus cyanescens]|uniref:ASX DEUBAD domain-containing protein n=1 Tax=Panaeolus cyanescens TaxID=181874 RepID=A0A409YEW1_9AGAR|nr:hypothetical protein CVT24_001854 [Panaeolus cyanescens]